MATAEPTFLVQQTSPSIPQSIKVFKGGSSRIPHALKIIFIKAAMGEEEEVEAPADGCAFQVFERGPQMDPSHLNTRVEVVAAKPSPLATRPPLARRLSCPHVLADETTTAMKEPCTQQHPPSAPIAGRRERNRIKGTQNCTSSSVERIPRRHSALGSMVSHSDHGVDNTSFLNRSLNRLRHGNDKCNKDNDEKSTVSNRSGRPFFSLSNHGGKGDSESHHKGALMKRLGFLGERLTRVTCHSTDGKKKTDEQRKRTSDASAATIDRQKQTKSLELGFVSVHGISDATQETVETEDCSLLSGANEKRLRDPDQQDTRTVEDLEVTGQAIREAQQSQPENAPLDPLSSHSKQSLAPLSSHSKQSLNALVAYPSQRSPQVFLDVMLRTRRYSTETSFTLETSYFNSPTLLQMASYHVRLQNLVRGEKTRELKEILNCGISPNPCNSHGESLLHTACRNGYDASVRCMVEECGTSVQVSDNCGRTPLHSAFFGTTPSYDIVHRLVKRDRRLLYLKDRHGATPLSYIPRDHWGMWIDYFYNNRDQFWPRRNKRFDGIAEASDKTNQKPNSSPLPDPSNALPKDMAIMVASGKLTPKEAICLMEVGDGDYNDDDSTDSSDSSTCSDSMYSESLKLHDSLYLDDPSAFNPDATYFSVETMFSARSKTESTAQNIDFNFSFNDSISVFTAESFA